MQVAYSGIGGQKAFTKWAQENPTEFYRLAYPLIPIVIRDTSDKTINVIIRRDGTPPGTVIDALPAIEHRQHDEDANGF